MSFESSFVISPLDWTLQPNTTVALGREDPAWPASNLLMADLAGDFGLARTPDLRTTSTVVHHDLGEGAWQDRAVQGIVLPRHNLSAGWWRIQADDNPLLPIVAQRMVPTGVYSSTALSGGFADVDNGADTPDDGTKVFLSPGQHVGLTFPTPAAALLAGGDRCVIRVRAQSLATTGHLLEVRAVEHDGVSATDIPSPRAVGTHPLRATGIDEVVVAFDPSDLVAPDGSNVAVLLTNKEATSGAIWVLEVEWMADSQEPALRTEWQPMTSALAGPGGVPAAVLPPREQTAAQTLPAAHARRYWLVEMRVFAASAPSLAVDAVGRPTRPTFMQLARAIVSPTVVGRMLGNKQMSIKAIGGDRQIAADGSTWFAAPLAYKRRFALEVWASAVQGFGEIVGGTVLSGLLAEPFGVSIVPAEHPDQQSVLSFMATWDFGSDVQVDLHATRRIESDQRTRVVIPIVEV